MFDVITWSICKSVLHKRQVNGYWNTSEICYLLVITQSLCRWHCKWKKPNWQFLSSLTDVEETTTTCKQVFVFSFIFRWRSHNKMKLLNFSLQYSEAILGKERFFCNLLLSAKRSKSLNSKWAWGRFFQI